MIREILAWTMSVIIFGGILAFVVVGAIYLANHYHPLIGLIWVILIAGWVRYFTDKG